jgi:hypothetical protein
MQQFIHGDDTQFSWLRSQIQERLMIFPDETLPASCTPSRSRLGFEYTQANGFKMYVDKNIAFNGNHSGFRALLAAGEMSFSTYENMIAFVRGLAHLFVNEQSVNSPVPPIFPTPIPMPPLPDPHFLTYPVTSPRGNHMNFSFKYEKHGPAWRAFIVNSPGYGSRAATAHATHRLTHTDGRQYVCWTPEPQRLDEITQVSKMWANATAKYIDTGVFAE